MLELEQVLHPFIRIVELLVCNCLLEIPLYHLKDLLRLPSLFLPRRDLPSRFEPKYLHLVANEITIDKLPRVCLAASESQRAPALRNHALEKVSTILKSKILLRKDESPLEI